MKLLERIAFFVLLATIPLQLGKHFWPDFSFVQGIRVDYLSPTLFISDVAFIALFAISVPRLWKSFAAFLVHPLTAVTLVILLIGGFIAVMPPSAFFGIAKFMEFLYLGFYIGKTFVRKDYSLFIFLLTLGGLVQTIILLLQFYSQRSLGGVFYYLGERTFDASTPGIAAFRWGDNLLMRPYGTFPHPNVLAFYLLCAFFFLLYSLDFRDKKTAGIKVGALLLLAVGIAATFSRTVFLLLLGVLFVWTVYHGQGMRKSIKVRVSLVAALTFGSFLAIFSSRFGIDMVRDLVLRVELLSIGFQIFIKNYVFGVGLNNFFYHEMFYQKQVTPTLLQPIHNIFAVWAVSTGIGGIIVALLFIKRVIHAVWGRHLMVLILCIFAVGTFDHYLLTLQQGQFILSLLMGLSFAKIKD